MNTSPVSLDQTDAPLLSASLPAARPAGHRWVLAAKLAVTVAVLGGLASWADWSGVAGRIASADPAWLAAGLTAKLLAVLFAGERWRDAVAAAGFRLSHTLAMRLMFAGLFFGQVLPGALGGDMVRGWLTYRSGCPGTGVVLALVLDRLLALLGCVMLLILGLPHLVATAPADIAWAAPGAAALAVGGLVVGLQADRVPLPAFLARRPAVAALRAQVARLRAVMMGRNALAGLLHSAAVHLCTVFAVVAYARALDLPVSALDALAVVPVTIVAAALPISLNGWGVREGAFVAGFALYGLGAAEALVLSLMIGLSVTLTALPGGLLWLGLKGRHAAGPLVSPPSTSSASPGTAP